MSRLVTQRLPAGQTLTVTTDSASTADVRRLAPDGSGTAYSPQHVAVSASLVLGPFSVQREYEIVSDGNAPTVAITQPDQNSAQLPVFNLVANGAITIQRGIVTLNKAGVLAATLAAPTAEQEGLMMHFTSKSANAHTITATGLLNDGVTGGAKNTATFAAFVGASITLIAINLAWHVLSANNVTVA